MSAELKNGVSHRALAWTTVKESGICNRDGL
jgi:hypothetical protein